MDRKTWPTIDPGRFRHLITLVEQTIGQDESGTMAAKYAVPPVPTTAWMDIEYTHGDEVIKAGIDTTQTFITVTGWYRAAWQANQRIQTLSGAQYIVQHVENVRQMNIYMILTCLGIGVGA
jgi:head-tail adaptor